MNEDDKGIGYFLDPGYKTKEDKAKEERNKFYKETIEPFIQGKKVIEPLGDTLTKETPIEKFLEEGPPIDVNKYEPVKKKTTFTDQEYENYLVKNAKDKEMVRKARQDPEWVEAYNKRFGPAFKTTVLPKDKPDTVQQLKNLDRWAKKKTGLANNWSVDKSGLPKTPVQKKRDQWNKKVEENKKKKPMPILTYMDRMSNMYDGKPREYDDNGNKLIKKENKSWPKSALKMAQEEADHLNSIKRSTWNNGGRVSPEPKYVSAQDVINVYEGPKASPEQMKGLHKRLHNHNQRTGQFPNVPPIQEEEHPYIQGKMDQLKEIYNKGDSITLGLLDPNYKKAKKEKKESKWRYEGRNYD